MPKTPRNGSDYDLLIRRYRESDNEKLLKLWYTASITAHSFIPADFWAQRINVVKNEYLPAAETYVAESRGEITGFISLMGNYVGALFVSEKHQGKGIGKALVEFARKLRGNLYVDVYKDNARAREFYKKCGFTEKREKLQEETGCSVITMMLEKGQE